MGDLICVDGHFEDHFLQIYRKFGVIVPVQDKIYTCREVVNHSIGVIGILLEELVNPPVPASTPIMGQFMREPTWKLSRFRKLDGSEITAEEIRETVKVKVTK